METGILLLQKGVLAASVQYQSASSAILLKAVILAITARERKRITKW